MLHDGTVDKRKALTARAAAVGAIGLAAAGHSIVVSRDGSVLVNANAGSNSISAFAVTPRGLRPIGTASSDGADPDSVTVAGDNVVYVLNADSETIAGFRLSPGRLGPIQHSVQPLGAGALVPKQVQFTNDGRVLVVTENGSNTIDTFVVARGMWGRRFSRIPRASERAPHGYRI
jgi:6-phosphogluconolactonase (cycloisomerase 2 family)